MKSREKYFFLRQMGHLLLCSVLLVSFLGPVESQGIPLTENIAKLIKLQQIDSRIALNKKNLIEAYRMKNPTVDKQTWDEVAQICDENEALAAIKDIYTNNLSSEEISQMILFFEQPSNDKKYEDLSRRMREIYQLIDKELLRLLEEKKELVKQLIESKGHVFVDIFETVPMNTSNLTPAKTSSQQ